MICFKCKGEAFATKPAVVTQVVRDEQLDVETPVSVCTSCGWQTLGKGQTDELRKRAADAYRQKNGLLTSAEIVSRRKSLAMSQIEFAAFLRVGEASVKRWETWQIQDAGNDELIRLKSDFYFRLRSQAEAMVTLALSKSTLSVTVRIEGAGQTFNPKDGGDQREPKTDFSLLNCRQIMPGGQAGRKHSAEVPDVDYDLTPDFTTAA